MNIAYIEDDQDSLNIFASRLRQDGFTCDLFRSAEDFIAKVEPGSYDVIIADIRLPGISGVEMIARLRADGILTPCVLITAFNSLEYARAALNASANYLLEKPFTYQTLVKTIQKITTSSLSVGYCVDRGLASLKLTRREMEVARLLLKGLTNHEIAEASGISEKTVKQYITQIFIKAGVGSRSEFFSSIFPV